MSACMYSSQMVLQSKDHDLTILIGEKETTYTYYSMILAARVPLIDAMLRHDMKEKSEMTIRFPDVSDSEWIMLELFIYPNSKYEFQNSISSLSQALELLPLAMRFQLEALQDLCDSKVSKRSTSMVCLVDVLSTYGAEALPDSSMLLLSRVINVNYSASDVTPELAEKLLKWCEMNCLWELFKKANSIPPSKGETIDMARKVHGGDDKDLLELLLFYRLAIEYSK